MRILLLQLPTSHFGARERVYPLGLARLVRLVPAHAEAAFLDMNLPADPWQALKNRLLAFAPDTVGLSFRNLDPLAGQHTSYIASLVTAVRLVRHLAPSCRIIAGGPAFSLFARRLMALVPEIDAGIVGEGEAAFPQWLAAPEAEGIPGLIHRSGAAIRDTPPSGRVDLDELPPPDLEAFPAEPYLDLNRYVAAFGIEGKRGCDLACGYCVYPQIGGRRMRLRSPASIVDEMASIQAACGASLFHFTDAVVNRPPEHFEAVCLEMIRRKLQVQWTGFFREDTLTGKSLALACHAGLAAVYFSGDALTDRGLRTLNKQMTMEDIYRAARLCANNGILTVCHFLVNLPGESQRDFVRARENLDRLLAVHAPAGNLGAVIFNSIRVYPGAPLTRRLVRERMMAPETDLLYPVYHDPAPSAHRRHELETRCHTAGVLARLNLSGAGPEDAS